MQRRHAETVRDQFATVACHARVHLVLGFTYVMAPASPGISSSQSGCWLPGCWSEGLSRGRPTVWFGMRSCVGFRCRAALGRSCLTSRCLRLCVRLGFDRSLRGRLLNSLCYWPRMRPLGRGSVRRPVGSGVRMRSRVRFGSRRPRTCRRSRRPRMWSGRRLPRWRLVHWPRRWPWHWRHLRSSHACQTLVIRDAMASRRESLQHEHPVPIVYPAAMGSCGI